MCLSGFSLPFDEIGSTVGMKQEILTDRFQAGGGCSLSCAGAGGVGERRGQRESSADVSHSLGSRNRGIHESTLHCGA